MSSTNRLNDISREGLGVRWAWVFAALLLTTAPRLGAQETAPPGSPTIRSQVDLVPVDVMVCGRDGRPVDGLGPDDFEVQENGVTRPVAFFARYAPPRSNEGTISPGTDPGQKGEKPAAAILPRNFIIFIGRMGSRDPFQSLAELERFLRERLLPTDRVAFMAYNRMTPFFPPGEEILGVLARYRQAFPWIESIMQVRTDDLLGIKEHDFAPDIQKMVNDIFEKTGSLRNRYMDGIGFPTSSTLGRLSKSDQAQGGRALMDLQNLHRAISILEWQPGAKHLLFFSADGLFLHNPAADHELALAANTARVVIHTFQTGGMDSGYTRQGVSTMTSLGSIRYIADNSGGLNYIHTPIEKGLDAVDALSRAAYTLGFEPGDNERPGKFKSIRVKVKRSGVTLHYRRYYRS